MNIKVLKLALDADDRITQEVKDKLLKESQILFEFQDHMSEKYDLDDKEIEVLTESYMKSRLETGTMEELISICESMATHYGFDRPEEFAKGLVSLITMMYPNSI